MGRSKIEWLARPGTIPWSWNPIRARRKSCDMVGWYCTKKSPGCDNCFAEAINLRLGTGLPYGPAGFASEVEVYLDEKVLNEPLRWRKPRTVFVCSMTDLFHDSVCTGWQRRIFQVMAQAKGSTFIVLTKRAHAMKMFFVNNTNMKGELRAWDDYIPLPIPNVWGMVTAEDQERADERIPLLLRLPFAVRGVSCEPLLGKINLSPWLGRTWVDCEDGAKEKPHPHTLSWIVAGGESGPRARPMRLDWARRLRDQCVASGVPYFHKQNGEWISFNQWRGGTSGWGRAVWFDDDTDRPPDMVRVGKKAAGRILDGREWNEWPNT